MRVNVDTLIRGQRVVFVPYKTSHVKRYHGWMQDPVLLRLTASKPLSLTEEYKLQQSWCDDGDKCTFIILKKELWDKGQCTEEECMIGDVNVFLMDLDDPSLAEIVVMIAEAGSRGRGFGKEAAAIMMQFGMQTLGIKTFQAKIDVGNHPSLSMFRKFAFEEVARSKVFQEVILQRAVTSEWQSWLQATLGIVTEESYIKSQARRTARVMR
uniref:alpha/beta-tubulin-N-acetyltransferase 9 isoform X2 n=1 Tax=Myxine glutinosa TaxID=7769 RepID=UPI00358FB07F